MLRRLPALTCLVVAVSNVAAAPKPHLYDAPAVWEPLTYDFYGPEHSQTDSDPNPFLDYRLQVTFTAPSGKPMEAIGLKFPVPSGTSLVVPGYFDGDGSGGPRGNVWRVRFTPTEPGKWTYRVSFRKGPGVAIDLNPNAGEPVAFDGKSGNITIRPCDPAAPGVYKWGLLEYVGTHYLKFRDGPYWIKTGLDEPENLLAYEGFANTRGSHKYADHVQHWRPGDPDWDDGKGKALIGALNYLADQHVNSIYFLTMNIGGDGKDVWPFAGEIKDRKGSPENDNLHYDVQKLGQWNIVFRHAQKRGLVLHFVLNEAEEANKRELDDGELGPERKLYYRELVARFAHHPALQWNLCEEYNIGGLNLGHERVRAFADYLAALDPYGHPITVHSAGDPVRELAFTFGDPRFTLTSIQLNQRRIDLVTEAVRQATIDAGRPLPVGLDEFTVDIGTNKSHIPADRPDDHRRQKLWPTLMSGGTIEFILEGLLKVDRFDTPERAKLWEYCWHARKFMEEHLPYWEMDPADELVEGAATIDVGIGGGKPSPMGAQVFAKRGEVYAVYLPNASQTGTIRVAIRGKTYIQRWYNPRTGEFVGDERRRNADTIPIPGGEVQFGIGAPPSDPGEDWVVLFRSTQPAAATTAAPPRVFPGERWQSLPPAAFGLEPGRLNALAEQLGGRGCIIKGGYIVKAWGGQDVVADWYSSAKPVLSTLLMFAAKEGKITSFDQPLVEFGWELKDKDRPMTLRHLTNMTSGYARPEAPGAAWSYNDFAIQLYQKTLFDRIFREDPEAAANSAQRLGALGLEDGIQLRKSNRRLSTSVRDFARIAWFWLNRGEWNGTQVLPRAYFDDNMRPQVPFDLPQTQMADTDDYLMIGTYGGGSDHFTQHGPGIYGFNWWFNGKGRAHPDSRAWPDAPEELWMSIGFAGNCTAMLPSQDAILVSAYGNWGKFDAGAADSDFNRILKQFAAAATPAATEQ